MNTITIIILCALGAIIVAMFLVLLKKLRDFQNKDIFAKLSGEALRQNNEQFLLLAKQVLEGQKSDIKTDLEGKKSAIAELIVEMRRDLRRNEERLSTSDQDRVRSFSALQNELESYKKITSELKGTTEQLKNVLSNNQLRGQFGEQVAEDLLKMAGFVIGHDYFVNQAQGENDTRPDFTILLPDKTKVNVDAKFPYQSLVRLVEAESAEEKERYRRLFIQDVKNKIKQVTTRGYINPQERTVDFVILFIPNEMIFSFIYDKMNAVWEEAMRKKVILAGPFSFTAILRMIRQAHTNFRYQENLQNIIGLIQKFDEEYQKYSTEVEKLGIRIDAVSSQYHTVSTTRERKLTSVVDKIKSQKTIDGPENNNPPQLIE